MSPSLPRLTGPLLTTGQHEERTLLAQWGSLPVDTRPRVQLSPAHATVVVDTLAAVWERRNDGAWSLREAWATGLPIKHNGHLSGHPSRLDLTDWPNQQLPEDIRALLAAHTPAGAVADHRRRAH